MSNLTEIQLDRTNVSKTSNCTLSIALPDGIPKGSKIALRKIAVENSFPNIRDPITFTYTFPGTNTTFPVSIPAPTNFSISDINELFQSVMTSNGHYQVDGDGNKVFYVSLVATPQYYGCAFVFSPVPSSKPAGYGADPVGWSYPAVNGTVFKVTISDPALISLLGIQAGTYPPNNTGLQSVRNTKTPNLNPYGTIYIASNLVRNRFSSRDDVIGNFIIDASFGNTISYEPNVLVFLPCEQTRTAIVRLTSESGEDLPMFESGYSCTLVLQLPE